MDGLPETQLPRSSSSANLCKAVAAVYCGPVESLQGERVLRRRHTRGMALLQFDKLTLPEAYGWVEVPLKHSRRAKSWE